MESRSLKVSARLVSLWRHYGRIFLCLFLLLAVSRNPWHSFAYRYFPTISTTIFTGPSSLCVYVCLCLHMVILWEYQSRDFGSILIQYDPILATYTCNDQTLLPRKITFWDSWWTWIWRDTIHPNTGHPWPPQIHVYPISKIHSPHLDIL